MAKDRSRPFSRKHFRYWMTVTGGMLLIGAINVAAGWLMWPGEPPPTEPIIFDIPKVELEAARLHAPEAAATTTPPGAPATITPDAGAAITPSGS